VDHHKFVLATADADQSRHLRRWIPRGEQMVKQNKVPLAVLAAVVILYRVIPQFWFSPDPIMLERDSDRIGWGSASEGSEVALDIYERVNDERVRRGLVPLAWHDGLADVAGRWSEEMLASGYRHSTYEFRAHPDFAGTGENIFMGPTDATEAHVGWMESDGHRANILHPDYTDVGIGVVCRNDGRLWATQVFGVRHGFHMSDPPLPPDDPIVRSDRGGTPCPSDPLDILRWN
jgi:hypothetical protein